MHLRYALIYVLSVYEDTRFPHLLHVVIDFTSFLPGINIVSCYINPNLELPYNFKYEASSLRDDY